MGFLLPFHNVLLTSATNKECREHCFHRQRYNMLHVHTNIVLTSSEHSDTVQNIFRATKFSENFSLRFYHFCYCVQILRHRPFNNSTQTTLSLRVLVHTTDDLFSIKADGLTIDTTSVSTTVSNALNTLNSHITM